MDSEMAPLAACEGMADSQEGDVEFVLMRPHLVHILLSVLVVVVAQGVWQYLKLQQLRHGLTTLESAATVLGVGISLILLTWVVIHFWPRARLRFSRDAVHWSWLWRRKALPYSSVSRVDVGTRGFYSEGPSLNIMVGDEGVSVDENDPVVLDAYCLLRERCGDAFDETLVRRDRFAPDEGFSACTELEPVRFEVMEGSGWMGLVGVYSLLAMASAFAHILNAPIALAILGGLALAIAVGAWWVWRREIRAVSFEHDAIRVERKCRTEVYPVSDLRDIEASGGGIRVGIEDKKVHVKVPLTGLRLLEFAGMLNAVYLGRVLGR